MNEFLLEESHELLGKVIFRIIYETIVADEIDNTDKDTTRIKKRLDFLGVGKILSINKVSIFNDFFRCKS